MDSTIQEMAMCRASFPVEEVKGQGQAGRSIFSISAPWLLAY